MSDPARTPAQAWEALLEGNARFAAGTPMRPAQDPGHRAGLTQGQKPFALVLGCSDSRVPMEIVFDRGLGELFVLRTAGHVADAVVMGSMEFGVGVLGIPLVVVLGHEACGAVAASVTAVEQAAMPHGWVRELVERVTPSVLAAQRAAGAAAVDREDVVVEHVQQTARLLVDRSPVLAAAVADGRCGVVGGVYALGSGVVSEVPVDLDGAPGGDGG